MGDIRDHQGGSATAQIATVMQIPTASGGLVIANAHQGRNAITIYNPGAAAIYAGYGTPAVPSQSMPIPAGGYLYEADYQGTVSLVSPAATGPAFIVEVGV